MGKPAMVAYSDILGFVLYYLLPMPDGSIHRMGPQDAYPSVVGRMRSFPSREDVFGKFGTSSPEQFRIFNHAAYHAAIWEA